jgi:hypothetical protein
VAAASDSADQDGDIANSEVHWNGTAPANSTELQAINQQVVEAFNATDNPKPVILGRMAQDVKDTLMAHRNLRNQLSAR